MASSNESEWESCRCDGELMPRWRGPEVMDDDANAMGYVCHPCGREFLPVLVRDRKLITPREPRA